MAAPSIMSPWYVVFMDIDDPETVEKNGTSIGYYQGEYSPTPHKFSDDKRNAMLFTNLPAAVRTAASEGAYVRVLVTKDEAKEFDRA